MNGNFIRVDNTVVNLDLVNHIDLQYQRPGESNCVRYWFNTPALPAGMGSPNFLDFTGNVAKSVRAHYDRMGQLSQIPTIAGGTEEVAQPAGQAGKAKTAGAR